MTSSRPTVLDVAKRAGVSVGTVSNVLNAANRVSDDRRQRVLNAIAELGYSQNLLAQGLRKRRSNMVGLCVPHTTNAYFAALVNAFEGLASDRGFQMMQVLSHLDGATEMARVEALLKYKIGGLILVPGIESEGTLERVLRSGTPLVVVDRPIDSGKFDEVTFDNRGAMYEVARRLIALGHRRLLFIVRQRGLIVTRQRIEGLSAAARESQKKVAARVLECGYDDVHLTAHLGAELRKQRPSTAIIVSNSTFAAWTLRALRSLKADYPRSVSLVAFDEPDWADLVTPRLSVVRQPTGAIACKAWEFLIRRMSEEDAPLQVEQLKAEVIFRESVEPVST